MSTPYMSEIKIYSFNFAPRSWAMCNGQLLPINQNQALFSLLGTTFGGNGQTTFGLPNLQGRTPMHWGNSFVLGQAGGEVSHTLTIPEMPTHTHQVSGSTAAPDSNTPAANNWATNTGFSPYANTPNTAMDPTTIPIAGGSQPHNNMAPYIVLNFCIALLGVFPSRN